MKEPPASRYPLCILHSRGSLLRMTLPLVQDEGPVDFRHVERFAAGGAAGPEDF
jgi:hypothetical protein